ncbi:MAG TPA: Hsp20/alpha crystallin family protein [Ktedonobacterales bacterium]|nr:Hsp20/alpha crystallin family protein [Ktedonobacterales bacterium]
MRLRYKLVTYHFGADQRSQQSVERHYRELVDELLRQGQHHALTHQAVQWRPATDIYETPEAIHFKMELAGMREEDIEITLYEDALVVAGRRADDAAPGSAIYYHEAQIRYGPFRAEIMLPGAVQREGVEARYENGFLCLKLPKVPGFQGEETRIEIKRGERPDTLPPSLRAGGDEGARAGDLSQPGAHDRNVFDNTMRGGLRDA